MKKLLMAIALLLVLALTVGMVGCSSYGSLKKGFEDAGYTESEAIQGIAKDFKEAAERDEIAITLHGLYNVKNLDFVLVMEFKATDDMKKFYDDNKVVRDNLDAIKENEDAKNFYDSLVEAGYANGNCLVINTNPLVAKNVKDIVKKA